jgi:hypothetical protein
MMWVRRFGAVLLPVFLASCGMGAGGFLDPGPADPGGSDPDTADPGTLDPGSSDVPGIDLPGDPGQVPDVPTVPDATDVPPDVPIVPDPGPEIILDVADPGPDPAWDPGPDLPQADPVPEAVQDIAPDLAGDAAEVPSDPGTDPGSDPGADPGFDPGAGTDTGPEADPGLEPGPDPDPDPGPEPGADAGPADTGYPPFPTATFSGNPLPRKVPGMRLFLTYTGDTTDTGTCGVITWKLGNRVILSGTSEDGVGRGRLTGAQVFADIDSWLDEDAYEDATGNAVPFPFIVELLGADHAAIWKGRLREPLQVREFVQKALKEKGGMDFSPFIATLVTAVLKADIEAMTFVIPDLPEAKFLRISREYSPGEKLAIAGDASCTLDTSKPLGIPIELGADATVDTDLAKIPQVPIAAFSTVAPGTEVKRLSGTMDPSSAVNFVILSDGFVLADKTAFEVRSQVVADKVLAREPYKSLAKFINVWQVWTPSPESGASYDCACTSWDSDSKNCTDPVDGCRDALRSTVYGSVFTIRALLKAAFQSPPDKQTDRNLFPLYLYRIGMAMSLTDAGGTPISGDAAIVLINDRKIGAFGLFNASVSTGYGDASGDDYLAEVATHELGHAFGLLGDEYHVSSDICQVFELTPLFPNFGPIPASKAGLAWQAWATLDGPYPSTEDQGTATDLGCFVPAPGGGVCNDGGGNPLVCRPAKTCKMKTNSGEFCPVCRDHVTKRIFRRVDLIVSPSFTVTEEDTGLFRIHADLAEVAVRTVWSLDGEVKSDAPAYQAFLLDVASLDPGDHLLTLSVEYDAVDVRLWTEALREEMTVKVTVAGSG